MNCDGALYWPDERVLVVSDRAARVERLAQRVGLSRGDAEGRLAEMETDRREFLQHHFGVDPDDPTHYAVVVNTASLGLDGAAKTVLEALAQRRT